MADALVPGALLERERELARIAGRLAEACAGAGGLTVIEGPAGIGKTSLLRAVREQARQAGMQVLAGRGSEHERDFGHGVIRQALERAVSALDDDERREVTSGPAAHAGALFEVGGSAVSSEALLHGLYWLVANLAERRPLVLTVDDAHWADDSSIAALAFLARRVDQLPVALVVATRPPDVAGQAALAKLVVDPAAERLTPGPLGADAIAAISASDDPAFLQAATRVTGGNPFLLEQLLRELGTDRRPESVARVEPRELGRIVLARIGDHARAFAWAVAILGERASPTECAALAEIEAPADAVEELVAAGVLADGVELRFRHPLIAAAVDAGLPTVRRTAWHARAAAMLQAAGADVERVAMHLAAMPPEASREVVDVLVAAADQTLARGAPSSAQSLLRRALAEPPDRAAHSRVLLALGDALTVTGDREAATVYAEAAHRSDDPHVQARAREARGWWWALTPDTIDGDLSEIDALLAALPAGEAPMRLRLEAVRLAIACRSAPAMADAMARAERLGLLDDGGPQHPDVLAHAALWRMQTGYSADDCASYALRAVTAATGAHRAIPPSLWFPFTTSVLQAAERLDEACASARSMQQVAQEQGSPTWYALTTHSHAKLLRDAGNLDEAEAEARLAVQAATASDGWMHALPTGTLVGLLLDRGQLPEAMREWSALGLPDAMPASRPMTELLVVRARLHEAHGRAAKALEDLREAARRLASFGSASMNDQPIRLRAALIEHAAGASDDARATAQQARDVADGWGADGARGAALRVAGLVAGDLELLRAAVTDLAASPLRLEHALGLADLGAALRRRGARRDAREPLREALELARDCRADALAAQVGEELAASGARVPTRPSTGIDALTPSEQRIARQAADGASNKEIAQTLFLSVKTIEMHLGNTYRKLDIGSRRELTRAFTADAA